MLVHAWLRLIQRGLTHIGETAYVAGGKDAKGSVILAIDAAGKSKEILSWPKTIHGLTTDGKDLYFSDTEPHGPTLHRVALPAATIRPHRACRRTTAHAPAEMRGVVLGALVALAVTPSK